MRPGQASIAAMIIAGVEVSALTELSGHRLESHRVGWETKPRQAFIKEIGS